MLATVASLTLVHNFKETPPVAQLFMSAEKMVYVIL